ncbi:hypothetical protein GCM10022255_114410 [Dactylosporangium darangshiense]|uniref:Uncharacterized protein n=2 Tax=Dactylosporangium darangshiense TaxID=579108 RepID=A0ABP8DVU6_9ACTN
MPLYQLAVNGIAALSTLMFALAATAALATGALWSSAQTAAMVPLAGLVAGVTFRAGRIGLFVSAKGVMIRRFGSTGRWAWRDVAAIEPRAAVLVTYGLSPGDQVIWLVLADGTAVETPVRSVRPPDRPTKHVPPDGTQWMDRSDFAMTLLAMRDLHRAALTGTDNA